MNFFFYWHIAIGKLTGYETRIGYVDVKTDSGVYFYVGRTSPYTTTESVIPYDVAQLNIGGAMNLASGVFTAPTNGRYHFNFVARAASDVTVTDVLLRLNGVQIAFGHGHFQYETFSISATVSLQKNDAIDIYLNQGAIHDTNNFWTQFTGILLEEDLVLS